MAVHAFICPYCGKKIDESNILFVYDGYPTLYADTVRFNFLTKCSSQWPFDNGDRFKGLYFHPVPENTRYEDTKHVPVVTYARLSAGLTPRELADPDMLNATGEEKPEPNDDPIPISNRACPHCHCRLPNNYGVYDTMFVSMMGGRAAGKTAFLLAMIHQLSTQLPSRALGSAQLHAESQIFYNLQNEYYQTHNGTTLPTPKDERLFPFVFEYTYFNNSVTKKCFVVIYDIAGEGMSQPDYLLGHLGIKQAKTVLLMLDPNMLNVGGYDAAIHSIAKDTIEPAPGMENQYDSEATAESHDFYDSPLTAFLAQSVVANRTLGVLEDVRNVIAVTTKMDQPLMVEPKYFGGNCILKEDLGNAHQGGLDLAVINKVHNDVGVFYERYHLSLVDAVRAAFSGGQQEKVKVIALACSTYTRVPGENIRFTNGFQEAAPKHRIVEPFLVLLHLAGMIPVRGAANPGPGPRPDPKPIKDDGKGGKGDKKKEKRGWFGRKKDK